MAQVVGYARCSTDEQTLSPAAQRRSLESWCAREGHELVAVYEDKGVSGAAPIDKRPGMLAAVDALQAGSILLVAKRDRLARDVVAAAMVERLVERKGATVASADGSGNGDSPEAQLFRRIVDSFAEYERALIRARTKAALAEKRQRGERVGRIPFGYRLSSDGIHLEQDDDEQEVLAILHALRADGMSYRAIAEELAERGVKARGGRAWSYRAVHRILTNDAARRAA